MVLTASTNTQLINFAEKMKLPLNNILMRDEMNELKNDGFYIINLDDSNGNGTHWTALYFQGNPLNSYYFDSFGFVPPLEVEQKIKPYLYNDADIQDFNSEACGYYCLAFIKFLHDKNDIELAFRQFLQLFGNKTTENDNILEKYLNI
jgi:hypothetical protein